MDGIEINAPFNDELLAELRVRQRVYLTGTIYTARDAAHKRLVRQDGKSFNVQGQTIYYAGPCPAKPGHVIGPIGPTTSGRMDAYTPYLLEHGLKAMIGKGCRSREVKDSMIKNKAVYFSAIGGAAALMMRCVKSAEIVAFEELGTEAIRKLTVERMPLIVAIDIYGGDIYELI